MKLSPQEILRKAADEIQQRGKCKNRFIDAEGRVCAVGAMRIAAFGGVGSESFAGPNMNAYDMARRAFDAYLEELEYSPDLIDWSDSLNTAQPVYQGFRHVADHFIEYLERQA